MIVSPKPVTPSPLSVIDEVLVTSIVFEFVMDTSVGSFIVLPSVSSPSSEVSETLFEKPGLLAVKTATFETPSLSTAVCSIEYVAV